jgi:hypothetical protein
MIIETGFLMVLSGVVSTFLYYSQEGDIKTLLGNRSELNALKEYDTPEKITQRLHDLIQYKNGYVRWNRYMIISMFVSMVLLKYFREKIEISEFFLTSVFIFAAIDLPNRWGNAHICKGVSVEASELYGKYLALLPAETKETRETKETKLI